MNASQLESWLAWNDDAHGNNNSSSSSSGSVYSSSSEHMYMVCLEMGRCHRNSTIKANGEIGKSELWLAGCCAVHVDAASSSGTAF